MGITLEQRFTLSAPPERVWAFMTDPVQVAGCLPGAAITSQVDERTYAGTMTVKIGPVTAAYKGTIRFERLDPQRLEAELVGRGQDVKGKGGAGMRMSSRLLPVEGGRTEVVVHADVNISGILAQMGRGMIESVSTQLFQQFSAAMQQRLGTAPGSGQPDDQTPPPEAKSLDALSLGAKAVGETMGRAVRRLFGGEGEKT